MEMRDKRDFINDLWGPRTHGAASDEMKEKLQLEVLIDIRDQLQLIANALQEKPLS